MLVFVPSWAWGWRMFILYYTLLYSTLLYSTLLYFTTLYYTILYYTILYYTILYYTILYYTGLDWTGLDETILHIPFWLELELLASTRRRGRGFRELFGRFRLAQAKLGG